MLEQVFPGNTEMARRMRELDWSATPLGPVENWPQSLKTSVSICLDCAFPIVLWWGPELTILYNDEYQSILGPAKHPSALGAPGAKVWSEIWDIIGPMLGSVIEKAEPTRSRDLMLSIDREGYQEEAYFSFSYSPIRAEDGKVGGIFCPVIETTEKVIAERRLRTLRDVASACKGAASEDEACRVVADVLGLNPQDVPFALIYRVNDDDVTAALCATAGIDHGHPAAPRSPLLSAGKSAGWSLGTAARTGKPQLLTDLRGRFETLPTGAWKALPHSALVLPVLLPGQERPRTILVAAVSPMRALDESYRTFYNLVASQIASGIADARALGEERRRAAALAEIDRAKTTFFSNVSHELRTPLTLMMSPLEDVLSGAQGSLPPQAAENLALAHRNSRRLLKLVNALLDFSRIEAGRADASYELTNLPAYTAELASLFRSAVEKAGLSLVVDAPPVDQPACVDRDMWEKIVLNLLSNALKFTFEGQVAVKLRLEGGKFVLSVSDTGVGIPPDDLPRMFERFHRVRNARSRTHEGTGIGLALVRELVRLHGGDVAVESHEGQGTTFVVVIPSGSAHLPAERIGARRQLASTSVSAAPFIEEAQRWLPDESADTGNLDEENDIASGLAGAQPRERILVADDNADMRDYLCRLLERRYVVTTVPDGMAALKSIDEERPDLVLSDVMMPGLDGFGLLAAVREDERTRTLPVILLSARAGEEARIEGLAAGADDYLIKPFSAREMLARVGSQLQLAQLRRDAERELRNYGSQFETLINRAPIGVYLVDADFKLRQVNPIAAPAFAVVPGDVVGRDFGEVIHLLRERACADEVEGIFRQVLETGVAHHANERPSPSDPTGREYFDWRVERLTLPDGRYGLVCYFSDISQHVAARRAVEHSREVLKAADRRKDEFLATLAHELRNPLAPIRNALRVLRLSDGSGVVAARTLEMMERQVSHMVRLVDDLMEVSRITRGKIELRREAVNVAVAVKSAVETSRPLIEALRHDLQVRLPREPLVLDADPVRIAQVIANLLNNAAKYTPEGGRIWLDVVRSGDEVVLIVKDSGAGIPSDALPNVFDLFMQVERTYDRSQGGLGIGLTLVRSLVKLHGGTVEARSEGAGRGSEFIVRLPLAAEMPQSGRHPGRISQPGAVVQNRILVVDDSRDAADSLDMLLRFLGAEVHAVYDGPSALTALDTFHPTVVLLDIGLPGLDGYEVARRMRAQVGGAVTIIALTGWGQEEDRRRSKEAGFDHHLIKPVDPETLEQLLASLTPLAPRDEPTLVGD